MSAPAQQDGTHNNKPRRRVSMRVERHALNVIDAAARTLGLDRTTFMVSNSVVAAEQVLMDRSIYMLKADEFETFTAALDKAVDIDSFNKLLNHKAPWSA